MSKANTVRLVRPLRSVDVSVGRWNVVAAVSAMGPLKKRNLMINTTSEMTERRIPLLTLEDLSNFVDSTERARKVIPFGVPSWSAV